MMLLNTLKILMFLFMAISIFWRLVDQIRGVEPYLIVSIGSLAVTLIGAYWIFKAIWQEL